MKNYFIKKTLEAKGILIINISAILFSSCEKVIDLNLKTSEPKIVINGNITDSLGAITVDISKTVNYNTDNVFPAVPNAIVTVTDDSGNVESLSESSQGKYVSSSKLFSVGHTYSLKVIAEDKTYSATSFMPAPVPIDSLGIEVINGFGFKDRKFVNVLYTDPANIKNYYRVFEYINGRRTKDFFYDSDEFRDGKKITLTTFNRDDKDELKSGDVVKIYLLSIDKGSYDYIRTLDAIYGDNAGQQASPANPISNLSNNALGYFSAYSLVSKEIIIP